MFDGLFPALGVEPLSDPVAQLGPLLMEMWDADRSDLITIATGVSAWAGIKQGLVLTQGTGSLQPVYSATGFAGGKGIVTFDGTDDQLTLTLAGQLPANADPGELWLLGSMAASPTDTTSRCAIAYGAANATCRSINTVGTPLSKISTRILLGDGTTLLSTNIIRNSFSSRAVIRMRVGSSTTTLFINNLLETSIAAVPTTTATRLRFGAGAAGTAANFFSGGIAVGAFTAPLPPALANAFTSYLLRRALI